MTRNADSDPGVEATLPLQPWRQLDWRFLLPEPALGTVLCDGRAVELIEALPLLTDTRVTVISDGGWRAMSSETADLVILTNPRRGELRHAVRTLKIGGWIYVQIERSPTTRALGDLLRAPRWFNSMGLEHVSRHWHAPDFESCARIVPLDVPSVLFSTLRRYHGIRFGRTKSLLGRAAVRTGLFPLAVRNGSIIGCRPHARGEPA